MHYMIDPTKQVTLVYLYDQPWCSSSGVMGRAEIGAAGGAPIVESLVVQALDNPTVESAMRAEAHWLRGIASARSQHEIDASKQSKPNL
jgi:hypothetical protein